MPFWAFQIELHEIAFFFRNDNDKSPETICYTKTNAKTTNKRYEMNWWNIYGRGLVMTINSVRCECVYVQAVCCCGTALCGTHQSPTVLTRDIHFSIKNICDWINKIYTHWQRYRYMKTGGYHRMLIRSNMPMISFERNSAIRQWHYCLSKENGDELWTKDVGCIYFIKIPPSRWSK